MPPRCPYSKFTKAVVLPHAFKFDSEIGLSDWEIGKVASTMCVCLCILSHLVLRKIWPVRVFTA